MRHLFAGAKEDVDEGSQEGSVKAKLKRRNYALKISRPPRVEIITKLTAGGSPAIPEYAIAWGITVSPTVMPATKSPTASSELYLGTEEAREEKKKPEVSQMYNKSISLSVAVSLYG